MLESQRSSPVLGPGAEAEPAKVEPHESCVAVSGSGCRGHGRGVPTFVSDDDTFDLDRDSDRAWRRLRRALARHLATMGDDDTLVLDVEAGDADEVGRYVQFAAEGDLL